MSNKTYLAVESYKDKESFGQKIKRFFGFVDDSQEEEQKEDKVSYVFENYLGGDDDVSSLVTSIISSDEEIVAALGSGLNVELVPEIADSEVIDGDPNIFDETFRNPKYDWWSGKTKQKSTKKK